MNSTRQAFPVMDAPQGQPAPWIPLQFDPLDGQHAFDAAGGLGHSAWYVGEDGNAHRAVRVEETMTLLSEAGQAMLLRGGALVLDTRLQRVKAIQKSAFTQTFSRSLSKGLVITSLGCDGLEQARLLMNASAGLGQRLANIYQSKGPRAWVKWHQLKKEQAQLDLWIGEIAQHLQDLKRFS